MTRPSRSPALNFFSTPRYPCSYLPDEDAVTLFADPSVRKSAALYQRLTDYGFRRSGEHLYRPRCPRCSACIPVRLPVAEVALNRNQRRCFNRNQDLRIRIRPAGYSAAGFALYQRYLASRHAGGGMDNPTAESFLDFLTATWSETEFHEMYLADQLACVAVVDRLPGGLSAVYTFFEPELERRSLGRFAVLYEVDLARRLELDYLYLGYWIRQSPKMRYKQEYQPLEYFIDGHWTRRLTGGRD